ncbi:MAG TPA: class I SAM-dependent methyltransferase [Phnomibacter sp.]|nr:class I SAM-dependent methyltransferase [Phnomibacter sp.]
MDASSNPDSNAACILCNNNLQNILYTVKEMMQGTKHVFHYLECSKCGCLQLLDPPVDMGTYYAKNYYSLQQDPTSLFKPFIKGWLKKKRDRFAITGSGLLGRIINQRMPSPNIELYNLRKVGLKTSDRILDVGSGAGLLTYIFYNAGFKHISGIDPYLSKDIIYDNGLKILNKPLADVTENSWDAILFHHSFEHMENPRLVLQQVYRLLKPGGKCVIRIPTSSSYAWQHYRENWVQIDAPRHYFLYSIPGLELLAAETGFTFQYLADESTSFQFTGSEQYKMGIPLHGDQRSFFEGNSKLFNKEQLYTFQKTSNDLNAKREGDSISVLLTRKNYI